MRWAVVASLLLLAPAARAQQFTLTDTTFTYTGNPFYYGLPAAPDRPRNWVTPVDYARGTLHMHVDVLSRPSNAPQVLYFCMSPPGADVCAYTPVFTAVGSYDWDELLSATNHTPNPDWSKGITGITVETAADKNFGTKLIAGQVSAELLAKYYPSKLHVVLTIVAAGATYRAASPSDGGAFDSAADGPSARGDVASRPPDGPEPRDGGTAREAADAAGPAPPSTMTAPAPAPMPDADPPPPTATRRGRSGGCSLPPGPMAPDAPPFAAALVAAALLARSRRAIRTERFIRRPEGLHDASASDRAGPRAGRDRLVHRGHRRGRRG